jgi:AAA15 family ATPase/GTPase
MHIEKIIISNFKSIKHLELSDTVFKIISLQRRYGGSQKRN